MTLLTYEDLKVLPLIGEEDEAKAAEWLIEHGIHPAAIANRARDYAEVFFANLPSLRDQDSRPEVLFSALFMAGFELGVMAAELHRERETKHDE